jgi:ribosomal protein S18 acetylase RimI-like enzyme
VKVRAGSDERSRARVRAWGGDPGVVQLALIDQDIVPEVEEIERWLARIDDERVRTVRTGALFPAAADQFGAAGFEVVDRLALLHVDLRANPPLVPAEPPVDTDITVTAPLRRHHHAAAAGVDRDAFGSSWANDVHDLEDIRAATPTHHATGRFVRRGRLRRDLAGFAISGAAGGTGYLQRLAVARAYQGGGHGRALTAESLAWMRRRRLRAALVNTAVTNEPALALYASFGFRRLDDQLVVMQRPVRDR